MFLLKAELMELDMELKNLAMAETFVSGEEHSTPTPRPKNLRVAHCFGVTINHSSHRALFPWKFKWHNVMKSFWPPRLRAADALLCVRSRVPILKLKHL